MSTTRHHAEWLSLIEASGPFLSLPVLDDAFPHGLDAHDPEVMRSLRRACEEWSDNQQGLRPDPAIHAAWVRFVVRDVLGFDDTLTHTGPARADALKAMVAEHGEMLRPDSVIQREGQLPRLLIHVVPPAQDLDKPLAGQRWKASPATRMAELLRTVGVCLGLVTNGEHWMLVHAQVGETSSYISWYASVWLDEPITLRAFRSLVGIYRLFGVPESETLEALFKASAGNQQEVTDQLGYQVREAVEVLVQTFDRIDKDRGRQLLMDVGESVLYEAALTVMMRLVFLFSAEERGLLLLGKPMYDTFYAVSTLRAQLRATADQIGEEVLERRFDAWSRLLATFRAVFGGVQHEDLRLLAYGGNLFNPDRYPFLEGRLPGTSWENTPAHPVAVDNRTVLHLLEALQILRISVRGGSAEPRRVSFRALDIEQIGHVYEGLLDHTARRASVPMLGLAGTKDREPEIALSELERLAQGGTKSATTIDMFSDGAALRNNKALIEALREATGRSASALMNALTALFDTRDLDGLRAACDNDTALFERVKPFAGLLRRDSFGRPVVITAGSVYVTTGTDRRTSGTHYTPRSLTEPIVQHTLDPLVYHGPAEGLPKEQWKLHTAEHILSLKVCDMAMGSGAFLVQACRYLAEQLAEAAEGRNEGSSSDRALNELFALRDSEERLSQARRLIADRCLYGADKNPLAVEMAKLSLWLITLQKDRPFTFLDHALRCGDTLLGINATKQLLYWNLAPEASGRTGFLTQPVERALERALALRRRIQATPVRDVRDAEQKARWLQEANEALELVKLAADLLVAAQFHKDKKRRAELTDSFGVRLSVAATAWEAVRRGGEGAPRGDANRDELAALRREADELLEGRTPFHWPLEFPEVFIEEAQEANGTQFMLDGLSEILSPLLAPLDGQSLVMDGLGFNAIVGNPPFQGGWKLTGMYGIPYRDHLVDYLARGKRGNADLCTYFFLRAGNIIRTNGLIGLIATNTIAQGDTREVGLDQLEQLGFLIVRAISSRKWPGVANLEVAHVWLRKGLWKGIKFLEDEKVTHITSLLTNHNSILGRPYRLKANSQTSYKGVDLMGIGFAIDPLEACILIEKDSRNREVLFPFMNGEDLNSQPDQSATRWAINFHNWDLQKAEIFEDCMKIVRDKVKPQRDRDNRKVYRDYWWQYGEKRPNLQLSTAKLQRVLVTTVVTKNLAFSFVPTGRIISKNVIVFSIEAFQYVGLLQSTIHEVWAREYGSTLETRLNYSSTDCFETFPFPASFVNLEIIGETYHEHRNQVMFTRQEGLTKTYNRFHNPDEESDDIAELRRLHVEMDQAVAAAYDWTDLNLGHGFHQTKQGLRYTISEPARRTVLDRLLLLNHERYNEEVVQGLHDKGAKKAASKGANGRKKVAEGQEVLF